MNGLLSYLRRNPKKTLVRPWALAGPILILLLCLPLLRPLRHPAEMDDDEAARLATVQSLVEHRTLKIDSSSFATSTRQKIRPLGSTGPTLADQPPVMAFLLSGPYWVMHHFGWTFNTAPILVPYLLTVIGVTLPVAGAAGLLYRTGRLFELPRQLRAMFGVAVVAGSGLLSYATVLNPHAPAAAFVLAAACILVHITALNSAKKSLGWLALAGLSAAAAAVIDPAAVVFASLFFLVIALLRWRIGLRFAGMLIYAIGLVPPVLLHAGLSLPAAHDWRLGLPGPQRWLLATRPGGARGDDDVQYDPDEELSSHPPDVQPPTVQFSLARFFGSLFGGHGLFVHFPVLIVGIVGVAAIMHRHWPAATKMLATVTVSGSLIVILFYVMTPTDFRQAMFASRWFVVFSPLLLFWSGAWLRRQHHTVAWSVAGVLLAFSSIVAMIGATNPLPREGYDRYTATAALRRLMAGEAPDINSALAGR